jgi:DNA-binding transcriptional ArsR family regulator
MSPKEYPNVIDLDDQLDLIFHALADRTRRSMLSRLTEGPTTITKLAEPFKMSLPGASKHLRVLERAGLVIRKVDGRIHRCELKTKPLQEALEWLNHHRAFWSDQLEALASFVESRNDQ